MKPQPVTDLQVRLGSDVRGLLPPRADIPAEFERWGNPYAKFVADRFYGGADARRLTEKPGIDRTMALRHLNAIMGSFEPSHEHKMGGVAYLLSLWFDLDTPAPQQTQPVNKKHKAKRK